MVGKIELLTVLLEYIDLLPQSQGIYQTVRKAVYMSGWVCPSPGLPLATPLYLNLNLVIMSEITLKSHLIILSEFLIFSNS